MGEFETREPTTNGARTSKILRKFERFNSLAAEEMKYEFWPDRPQHTIEIDKSKAILLWVIIDDFENNKEIFIPATEKQRAQDQKDHEKLQA